MRRIKQSCFNHTTVSSRHSVRHAISSRYSVKLLAALGTEVMLGLDTDNDNKPDVLDFDGVQQLYAKTDGAEISGTVHFLTRTARTSSKLN